jgi:hypothetical protein
VTALAACAAFFAILAVVVAYGLLALGHRDDVTRLLANEKRGRWFPECPYCERLRRERCSGHGWERAR